MNIARVFPRRTNWSPDDDLAFFDVPGMPELMPDIDEVHVSCTFIDDRGRAEWLAQQWQHIAPVKIGGPAYDDVGGEFEPGRYLKNGATITSRGCPNKCWFCYVWKREGVIRELEIKPGWNVMDSNLLACSEAHVRAVFTMLQTQTRQINFSGGLEAALLRDWHINLLAQLKHKPNMFFAFDEPSDEEPLRCAAKLLDDGSFLQSHHTRCYVLIGYPRDTIDAAQQRLALVARLGFFPMAMLWQDGKTIQPPEWRRFQRGWAAPAAIGAQIAKIRLEAGNENSKN